jgi:hypothetical protein
MSKSKKYFSIENFRCQLVTHVRQEGEVTIVDILHPNTKDVLDTRRFLPEEIKGDRVDFLMAAGAAMKAGINVETELQVPTQSQTRRTGYKKK